MNFPLTVQPVVPAASPIDAHTLEQWTSTTIALMNDSLPRSRQMSMQADPDQLLAPYTGKNQLRVDAGDLVFSLGPKAPAGLKNMCNSAFSSFNGLPVPEEHEKYVHYMFRGIATSPFDFSECSGSTTGVTAVARGGVNLLNSSGITMHAGETLVWDVRKTGSDWEPMRFINGVKRRKFKKDGSVKAFLRPIRHSDFGEHLRSGIPHLMKQFAGTRPPPRSAQLTSEDMRSKMDSDTYSALATVMLPLSVIAFSTLLTAFDMGIIDGFVPEEQREKNRPLGDVARTLAVSLGLAWAGDADVFEPEFVLNVLKRTYFPHARTVFGDEALGDRMNPLKYLQGVPVASGLMMAFSKIFTDAMSDRSAIFMRGIVGEAGETIRNGSVGTVIL